MNNRKSIEERLLGFDAREMQVEPDSDWAEGRRAAYLLRTDVDKPLSTDVLVWPSVLDVDGNVESATSVNEIFHLWNSLFHLKEYLRASEDVTRKPFWIIGITLLWSVLSEQEQELWAPRLPVTSPPARDENWSFLGYDVSDLALLSGLSNCGYDAEKLLSLKERWGPQLNRFHLFTEERQSMEFKLMNDDRVPEHAPFFVYVLYLVERG